MKITFSIASVLGILISNKIALTFPAGDPKLILVLAAQAVSVLVSVGYLAGILCQMTPSTHLLKVKAGLFLGLGALSFAMFVVGTYFSAQVGSQVALVALCDGAVVGIISLIYMALTLATIFGAIRQVPR